MKSVFIAFVLAVALIIPGVWSYIQVTSEIIKAFNAFVVEFNKTYATSADRGRAIVNFAAEYVSIQDHNAKYEAKDLSFGRKICQLSDKTLKEKQDNMNGLKTNVSSFFSSAPSVSSNFNDYGFDSFGSFIFKSSSSSSIFGRKKREAVFNFPPGPEEFDWRDHGAVTG